MILATFAVVFTGCLKDKGFNDHTYGINDPDTQPPGVGFPLGATVKNPVGLDAGVATLQAINNIVFVKLETGNPASADVHITLVLNDALRVAYNLANGTNILAMPAAFYNVSLNVLIAAGATSGQVPINIPTTVPLDPSNSYGLGLSISSVTGGYTIASNLKDLFLELSIKNKYDGKYGMLINSQGWALYGIADDTLFRPWGSATESIELVTGGPNSVRFFDAFWFGDFIQVCLLGPNGDVVAGFGDTAPRYVFNTATDQLIDVINDIAPFPPRNRAFRINPAVVPPVGNFWDPGTRKILGSYIMSQTGRPDQFINVILTYRGPRP